MTGYMPGRERRAPDREVGIMYRCSVERREELRRRAHEQGVSVQVYLESILWDEPLQQDRKSGPRGQQELPLTG